MLALKLVTSDTLYNEKNKYNTFLISHPEM